MSHPHTKLISWAINPQDCCYFEGCVPEVWLVEAARGGTLKILPLVFLFFPCVMWTSCQPLLTPEHSSSALSSLGRQTVTLWIQESTNHFLNWFWQPGGLFDHWWRITQPKVGNMAIMNRLLGGAQRFIMQHQEDSAGWESSGLLSSWNWTKSRFSILHFPNLFFPFLFPLILLIIILKEFLVFCVNKCH